MRSIIETYEVATGRVREVLAVEGRIEAPNWAPSGDWLLVNGDGRLFRVPLAKPALEPVDTGAAVKCNNDHGISPDGATIILSSHHEGAGTPGLCDAGGRRRAGEGVAREPELVARGLAGWADADLCRGAGRQPGDRRLYAGAGAAETRLTNGEGHCDGPDFSPDGSRIYYNCDRTGHAQIWVMAADGSGQRQLFEDGLRQLVPASLTRTGGTFCIWPIRRGRRGIRRICPWRWCCAIPRAATGGGCASSPAGRDDQRAVLGAGCPAPSPMCAMSLKPVADR